MALVPKSKGKHRVSQAEASLRLIDATIKLAGDTLMSELTVGKIANEAGLGSGNVLVKRYFGKTSFLRLLQNWPIRSSPC